MIIGLVGRARSGKDSVANVLCDEFGYSRGKFAKPLKDMLRTLLRAAGSASFSLNYWIEGDGKELPCPYLMGKTPRHAMVTLGTDWGRKMIDADLWALIGSNVSGNVVFSDCRFLNEAEAIKRRGGMLIRVSRPCVDILPATHESESELARITVDYVLSNVGTLESLADKVRFMCDVYGIKRYSRPRSTPIFKSAPPANPYTGIGK